VKTLNIREMRQAWSCIDEIVAKEGEIVVTRRGRPVARVLPVRPRRRLPSNAALRASMPRMKTPSEILIREDRDAR
jgi:prevent-host-death family protein